MTDVKPTVEATQAARDAAADCANIFDPAVAGYIRRGTADYHGLVKRLTQFEQETLARHRTASARQDVREASWSYVAGLPMWSVAVVTDGERVAIAQKAEADFDGYYWAIEPDDALDWEPTHCIALPAALDSSTPVDELQRLGQEYDSSTPDIKVSEPTKRMEETIGAKFVQSASDSGTPESGVGTEAFDRLVDLHDAVALTGEHSDSATVADLIASSNEFDAARTFLHSCQDVRTPESGAGDVGRFGHHPDPAIDFEHEVEQLESIVSDLALGLREGEEIPMVRIERAMGFRVGGDQGCVLAKAALRDIERRAKALSTRPNEGEKFPSEAEWNAQSEDERRQFLNARYRTARQDLREVVSRFLADYDDGDRADAGVHPLMEAHVADFRAALSTSPRPNETEASGDGERLREQGQREGKAAVCQWLRDRAATRPPETLWSAAAILADQFEQSEQPCAALASPEGEGK